MKRRSKLSGCTVVLAILVSLGAFQGTAAREQNVCVSYDGIEYVDLGSADCYSRPGSSAVAVGDESYANSDYDGTGNTAVTVGDGGDSYAGDGDNNTSVAVGEDGYADSGYGDNDMSVAIGDGSYTVTYGYNNTGIAVGDDSTVYVEYDDGSGADNRNDTGIAVGDDSYVDIEDSDGSTGIAVGDDSEVEIYDDDNCFVVELFGTEYEFGDCD